MLLALIGIGTSIMTFCLMRFPHVRRPQFQAYGPFSLTASFVGALAIFVISLLMVSTQGVLG
jgi:hypothetical protein